MIEAIRSGAGAVKVNGVTHEGVRIEIRTVQPGDVKREGTILDRIPRDARTLRLEADAQRAQQAVSAGNRHTLPRD
jgi:hypothetical protein